MLIVHGYSEVCHVCQITKATPSTLESIHQHGIHTNAIAFGNREEKSLRLVVMVAKNSGSQQIVVLQISQKKLKLINMHDFVPVHDCTQKQNGNPYFSSHRSTIQMAISVKKDC